MFKRFHYHILSCFALVACCCFYFRLYCSYLSIFSWPPQGSLSLCLIFLKNPLFFPLYFQFLTLCICHFLCSLTTCTIHNRKSTSWNGLGFIEFQNLTKLYFQCSVYCVVIVLYIIHGTI